MLNVRRDTRDTRDTTIVTEPRIPVFRPSGSEAEKALLAQVIDSGWWGYGPVAKQFEAMVCSTTGAAEALAVTSGTSALHLALMLAGVGPGDEVIVPPMTFASTAMVVLYLGATPVFADVDAEYLELTAESVRAVLTEKTKAAILVHYTGVPGPVDAVAAVLATVGAVLIEDAAHALGAAIGDRPVGSISPFTCFSHNAVKNVAAGEGGTVCFTDPALRERAERLSWMGLSAQTYDLSRDVPQRAPAVVHGIGFKYRLPDLNAAVALAQLRRLPEFMTKKRAIAAEYRRLLADVPEVMLPAERPGTTNAWHMFIIRVQPEHRDALRAFLGDRGVETAVHYPALSEAPFFVDAARATPVASTQTLRLITLPFFSDLPLDHVARVADGISAYFAARR